MRRRMIFVWAAALLISEMPLAKETKPSATGNYEARPAESQKPPEHPAAATTPPASPIAPKDSGGPKIHEAQASEENKEKNDGLVEWTKKLFYDLKITDIVIALASVALAIYTLQLRRATNQLAKEGNLQRRDARRAAARQAWQTRKSLVIAKESADAAKAAAEATALQAKAAIGIELPIIRAEWPELLDIHEPVPEIGPYAGGIVDLIPGRYSVVPCIVFHNRGRTIAFADRMQIGWEVCGNLPEIPAYRRTARISLNSDISENDDARFDCPRHTIELSQPEIEGLIEGKYEFWFFISLEYEDFIGARHEGRFCWKWGCPDGVGIHYFFSDLDAPEAYRRKT